MRLIVRTLESALVKNQEKPSEALPEEVISASVVIAANLSSGKNYPWDREVPEITGWLTNPVPPRVRDLALEALEVSLPVDGWWWRSWVDNAERKQMEVVLGEVKRVLREG